jgi:hypothetical protein
VLVDNGDNVSGAAAAFRLAAHVPEDGPNRRALIPGADGFADFLIGQHVAGTDDHKPAHFGKVSNYIVYQ